MKLKIEEDEAMRHETPGQKRKVRRVMHEYKAGRLKAGSSDQSVRDAKQAIAIALREAGVARPSTRRR
jgi:hypothetical protein